MKAKIIDEKNNSYGKIFEVVHLSFDTAAGYEKGIRVPIYAPLKAIEFIFDYNWEKEIVKHRNILNIIKPKKASYYLYYAILKSLRDHLGEEIIEIDVIKDSDEDVKRAWIKRIEVVCNGRPISVEIVGKNYANVFDIKASDIKIEEFIRECQEEIEELKIGLDLYTKRINGLVYTIKNLKDEKLYTSTHELSIKGA